MERAPPPSPAAAALAALDEVLMETSMSPKQPRQDSPQARWAQMPPRHTPHHHEQHAESCHADSYNLIKQATPKQATLKQATPKQATPKQGRHLPRQLRRTPKREVTTAVVT
eukprot:scaffold92514_cov28-Tisochrysis_lutea.AAC.2